jgi:hypothetical protein
MMDAHSIAEPLKGAGIVEDLDTLALKSVQTV